MKKKVKILGLLGALFLFAASADAQVCMGLAGSGCPGGSGGGITAGTTTITGGTNTRVIFNDSGVWGEDAGFTYMKATDIATLLGGLTIGSVTTAGRATTNFLDTISGSSATSNFLNITGTFPATLSAATSAAYFSVTPDNDGQSQYGIRSIVGAGGGLSQVASIYGSNASVSSLARFDVASTSANPFGVLGSVSGDNNGQYFAGVGGVATGGTGIKAGVLGMAANTAGSAVGVFGGSLASATNNFAGYFVFSTGQLSLGTGNAALVADNSSVAANIFEARDNGTAVLTVADGGATTFTQPVTIPQGASGAPSLKFSSGTTTGFYNRGANRITVTGSSAQTVEFDQGGVYIASTGSIFMVDGALGGGTGTTITQDAANALQLGSDVNGAAVAQTLKAHDGITGTDIAGANFTLAAGRGTGAGTAGNLRIQTAIPVSTGTTAQVLADRELFVAKNLSVADNTATTMFTITLGDDTDGGGIVDFCSMATSAATDRQKTCGQIAFSGIDVTAGAGGEACSAAITGTNSTAVSVGTLTVTAAATTGTDLCNIRITSDSSLNVAHTVRYSVRLHPSASTVVITPQ